MSNPNSNDAPIGQDTSVAPQLPKFYMTDPLLQDDTHCRQHLLNEIRSRRENFAFMLDILTPITIKLFKLTGYGPVYLRYLSQDPSQARHRELRRRFMSDWANAGYLDQLKEVAENQETLSVTGGIQHTARDCIEPVLYDLAAAYRVWVELGIDMQYIQRNFDRDYLWGRFGRLVHPTLHPVPTGMDFWSCNRRGLAAFAKEEEWKVNRWVSTWRFIYL